MSVFIPFKTSEPVEFKEPKVEGTLEAEFCGKAEVFEYDTSLYQTEDDLKAAIRSNINPIAKDSFENWPTDSIVDSKTERLLGSYFEEALQKIGITATVEIDSFKLTDESQEKYNSSEAADILAPFRKNQPTLDDLAPETHGPVVMIETYSSSHGMTMNSGSSNRESVTWQDDGTVIIQRSDSSYEKQTFSKYIGGKEEADKLRAYVAESRIAEMAQIKPIPFPFAMTDYSSSSHMTFTFDDSAITGEKIVTRTIDRSSFWELQTKVIRKIDELINECIKTGKIIDLSEQENENANPGMIFGSIGMMPGNLPPAQPAQPSPSISANAPVSASGETWKCSCGTENSGKFCCNCGCAKPVAKWKCPNCGSENEGRFCPECGTVRPS